MLEIHFFGKVRFQHHKQGKQHQRQQHQHHRQAVLHPAGEVQIERLGGNRVGRRAHQRAQAADTGAVGNAQQHEYIGFAVFFLIDVPHQPHGQRQHHRGGGGVADPHGKAGGNGKHHHHRRQHIAARERNHQHGDFSIQPLHVHGCRQRETAEKHINNRIGKAGKGFFGAHIRNFEENR